MHKAIHSESATLLDAMQLQKILATPNYPVRVLACAQVSGNDRNPIYAYVTADEEGDYFVWRIRLTRTALSSNTFRVGSKPELNTGPLDTMYHAMQVIDGLRQGKFRSLSGPPPLSSAVFSLNEFGIAPSPLLDSVLAEWNSTQTIAPLRYAVYNPPRNEIEVSFVDPSAHNDEEHQLKLKQAIGQELKTLFEQGHAVPDEDIPSGRYTRRPLNNRIHNMSLIRLNLDDDTFQSESAKAPGYKFAKVEGKATLVLPSSKRAGLTEIKTHLKRAKSDRTKALRLTARHAALIKQAGAAPTVERRKVLRAKAKVIKGQVSALNKSSKAALTAANKSARTHGLSGLTMPLNTTILTSAKKLASAKTDVFGATGKRGQFKPRFAPDAKFEALGAGTVTKAAKKAPAASTKMPGNAAAIKRTKQRIAEKRANGTLKPTHVAVKNKGGKVGAAKKSDAVTAATQTGSGTPYRTKEQKNDAANQSLHKQSMDWDKQNRVAKRMLKEINGGKSIKASDGWTGSVTKTGATFTNKRGQKIVVKAADLKKHGLTVDNLDRSLGEIDIARS